MAALVVARIVAVLILNQKPGMSDDALNILYLAAVFVPETAAGGLLMRHLHWARRFMVLALVPVVITVMAVVGLAVSSNVAGSVLERLQFMAGFHVEWFVASAAILCGATLVRWTHRGKPETHQG